MTTQQPQPGYGGQPAPGYGPAPGAAPAGYGPPAGQPGYGAATVPPAAGGGAGWMERPTLAGCPPGLEYMSQLDQLLVQQQVELLEAFTGWESANKYVVKNSMGQQVYYAAEESETCERQCCGNQRGFVIHITDNMQQELIRVHRPFKFCAGNAWCANADCCAMEVTVEAPPGQPVGYVRQSQSCITPMYTILDANRQVVLNIEGPICICQGPCCTQDQEFVVFSADKSVEVGKISKQWSGLVKEYFTNADNFGIKFPQDLDVKMKAVMLGATFLIDFMFFEHNDDNN